MDAQTTFSCSFTQSDLGPVVELPSLSHWPGQRLLPQERQDLAIQVLTGAQPVSDLARGTDWRRPEETRHCLPIKAPRAPGARR